MWDTLFTLFDLYGPIPRLLFETLLTPKNYRPGMVSNSTAKDDEELNCRIGEYRDELENKIRDVVQLDPNKVLSTEYGVNSSHTIYTMRPGKMKKYQYVSLCRIRLRHHGHRPYGCGGNDCHFPERCPEVVRLSFASGRDQNLCRLGF